MVKSHGVKKQGQNCYLSKTNIDWARRKKEQGKLDSVSQGADIGMTMTRLIEEKAPAIVEVLKEK